MLADGHAQAWVHAFVFVTCILFVVLPFPNVTPPASLSLSRARGHSRRTHHPRWGKGGWVVACVRVGAARVLLSTFQHAICAHRLFLLWCNKTGLLLPRGSVTSSNVSSAAVLQKRERDGLLKLTSGRHSPRANATPQTGCRGRTIYQPRVRIVRKYGGDDNQRNVAAAKTCRMKRRIGTIFVVVVLGGIAAAPLRRGDLRTCVRWRLTQQIGRMREKSPHTHLRPLKPARTNSNGCTAARR